MRSFILFIVLLASIDARVIQTDKIHDIIHLIDDDSWVLVDLDNCLYQSAQALGHANWFYDEMQKRLDKGMSRDEAIADAYPEWIKIQKVCRVRPIDEAFISLLLNLQNKPITIMGLTHRQPSVVDSTIRQVQSLGIDFTKTAPSQDSFSIVSKTPTLYYGGILFVGDYNKKIDIFVPFMTHIGMKPKKVVFIDDKKKNVDELEMIVQYGIEYIGVHYTAIEQLEPVYRSDIAEFQYKQLGEILSNEDALMLIERKY